MWGSEAVFAAGRAGAVPRALRVPGDVPGPPGLPQDGHTLQIHIVKNELMPRGSF